MTEPARRRPRTRPPAGSQAPAQGGSEAAPALGRNPFGLVIGGALVLIGVVIAVAFATGTGDDLPWGAIIGLLAVLAFAWVAGRRRRRTIADDDADDEP